MKLLTLSLIAISFAFSGQALAACEKSDSKAEARLIQMFQLNGRPTDWVSVKQRTNLDDTEIKIQKNRSFPIEVFASRRISSSRIVFKRENYDLSDAKICTKKKSILIVHPRGELLVRRKGNTLNDSVISLKENGGVFKLRLRPTKILGGKSSVTLEI